MNLVSLIDMWLFKLYTFSAIFLHCGFQGNSFIQVIEFTNSIIHDIFLLTFQCLQELQ